MAIEISPQIDPAIRSLLAADAAEIKLPLLEATKVAAPSVLVSELNSSSVTPTNKREDGTELESGPSFDPKALQAQYDAERDKRLAANSKGVGQYIAVNDPDHPVFGRYLRDPYITNNIVRDAIEAETEVLVIGGGYGGQLVAVRLIEKGITNIKIVEKGGDFGGTWYWNRYPGAQCDVESYVYMPLLPETGCIPTEKYARCDELLRHAQMLGRHYCLYERALFQTEIKHLEWDESKSRWLARTDRGDSLWARFVVSASGPLHKPKLPGLPGLASFEGHSFHTTRWDYDYTGGNTRGNLHKLADKRVGIIGTGATAVQVVPRLAECAKEVFVFQRTPSSIDVRGNRPTDPEWVQSLGEGWQKNRMDNFNIIVNGGYQEEDLVSDGWTDIMRKLLPQLPDDTSKDVDLVAMAKKQQMYDFEKMEQIRARVDSIVKNSHTADKLKPFYRQFCKRPCFHDEYLQSFNQPNVHLVDTDGRGVQAITKRGVMVSGKEYELDCLIYATGFDMATEWTKRSGYEVVGEDGLALSEKWRNGPSTFHGWTTRSFPNCCFIQVTQAAITPNIIHVTDEQAKHFAYVISEAKRRGIETFQPTQAAEDAWVQTILDLGKFREAFNKECTPGYYNNEGKFSIVAAKSATYGAGALKFFELVD
ncbi:hypothetical protein H2200_003224 [Cladophialophora chaetospira]|uniref:FAD/NAD(P)-binding domain-containing protein n=1 Tax=Cladophialophora chaetospira TaxID=386627 RepID=A0AA39CM30_9EURO|nr:hypothetical protein H2200_003224 [Cladophialophora chaetospira]